MNRALLTLLLFSLASCQDTIVLPDLATANRIINSLSSGTLNTQVDTNTGNLGAGVLGGDAVLTDANSGSASGSASSGTIT